MKWLHRPPTYLGNISWFPLSSWGRSEAKSPKMQASTFGESSGEVPRFNGENVNCGFLVKLRSLEISSLEMSRDVSSLDSGSMLSRNHEWTPWVVGFFTGTEIQALPISFESVEETRQVLAKCARFTVVHNWKVECIERNWTKRHCKEWKCTLAWFSMDLSTRGSCINVVRIVCIIQDPDAFRIDFTGRYKWVWCLRSIKVHPPKPGSGDGQKFGGLRVGPGWDGTVRARPKRLVSHFHVEMAPTTGGWCPLFWTLSQRQVQPLPASVRADLTWSYTGAWVQ